MTLEEAVSYCKIKQKEMMEELQIATDYDTIARLQTAHLKSKEYIQFLEGLIDDTKTTSD